MTATDPVVIVGTARTPMGELHGALSGLSAPQLAAAAIRAAMDRAGIAADQVEEVILGCVLPAGLGQAPARQASRAAGIPDAAGCTTINKVCGSGMKAAMFATDLLLAGTNRVMVAGGMESMSNAPYLLEKVRAGLHLGHARTLDHIFLDGLEDAYDKGRLMGSFAEDCAQSYGFTRQTQDAFALTSLSRARIASDDGTFAKEITPITVKGRMGETIIAMDQRPAHVDFHKITTLKPAFREGGTVTAANSSSISDGAAALVMMRRSEAENRCLRPLVQVVGHATFAQAPALFTTAPVGAITKVLEKAGWQAGEVDLYEINEAFAVVTMAAMYDLRLPSDKVNVHGGACALGHPIGASGARIIVTLLTALEKYGLKRGVASLCIGGGEATAMAFERLG